jgi:hypothetical protein
MTKRKVDEKLDGAQLRQGDVMLVRVGDAEAVKAVKAAEEDVVLRFGEVTGHAHRFMAESRVSFLGRVREQLAVGAPAALRHEEHSPATLLPGIYDLPVQVEHVDADEPRIVAD